MPLPLAVEDVRGFVGAEITDDALLTRLQSAAVDVIEEWIGGRVMPVTVTEQHDRRGTLILHNAHVASLTSVTDAAGTLLSGYTLDGSLLRSDYGYSGPVIVTYVAGFDPVPAAIELAILYTVQHAWESQRGSIPVPFQSGADETFTMSRGFFMPNRAKELLAPYRAGPAIA
jgi:hypothetical protein